MSPGSPSDSGRRGVDFLYTSIGRGHAFYLDGIRACLPEDVVGHVCDAERSWHGSSRWFWKAAELAYRWGASGPRVAAFYSRFRGGRKYGDSSNWIQWLRRGLDPDFTRRQSLLVVGHPILAATLNDRPGLIYQHGEVSAPREACVDGDFAVCVPLASTADAMVGAGVSRRRIFVSGLCVEPGLVAQAEKAFEVRRARIESRAPLSGAFFSSGAEPIPHVRQLSAAMMSLVQTGGHAIAFARSGGRLASTVIRLFSRAGVPLEVRRADLVQGAHDPAAARLCLFDTRQELDAGTALHFPRFDFVMAPSHERTHWALGLGLPMVIVDPPIGSYAPLNHTVLLNAGVAVRLGDVGPVRDFGRGMHRLRGAGTMSAMAEHGWRRHRIDGFSSIARFLVRPA